MDMTKEMLMIIGNNSCAGLPTRLYEIDDLLGRNEYDNVRRMVKYFEHIGVLEWTDDGVMMTAKGHNYYGEMR